MTLMLVPGVGEGKVEEPLKPKRKTPTKPRSVVIGMRIGEVSQFLFTKEPGLREIEFCQRLIMEGRKFRGELV